MCGKEISLNKRCRPLTEGYTFLKKNSRPVCLPCYDTVVDDKIDLSNLPASVVKKTRARIGRKRKKK